MTSIIQFEDKACAYPAVVGHNVTLAVGNTVKVCAVFRNLSNFEDLTAAMRMFSSTPIHANDDTLVTVQLVGGVTAVGGSWESIPNSELEVNTTATGITGGIVGITIGQVATQGHGNNPPSSSLTAIQAEELGLVLRRGNQFAIVACTEHAGATIDLHWSVNWFERG